MRAIGQDFWSREAIFTKETNQSLRSVNQNESIEHIQKSANTFPIADLTANNPKKKNAQNALGYLKV